MRPNIISLFSGAGGMSLGFSDRFNIALAVDNNPHSVRTYRANFPTTKVLINEIDSVDWTTELDQLGLLPSDIDVIIGGPPCQGFSMGNRQSRRPDHPLNILWESYLRIVDSIQPAWFVMENVIGLLRIEDQRTGDLIKERFNEIGYHVEVKILCAADYGVPQIRRRVVFVGNKDGYKFKFPKPLFHKDNYITIGEAIVGDLPPLENADGSLKEDLFTEMPYSSMPRCQYQDIVRNGSRFVTSHFTSQSSEAVRNRWRDIQPGGNWSQISRKNKKGWRNVSDDELERVSHSNLYKRLDPSRPSITIANFRRSMICHPVESRIISVREAARIQSFPDTYNFIGTKTAQQQMVADAVPPLLSRAIARQLYFIIRGWIKLERPQETPAQFDLMPALLE